jgi:RNA polymerase sigma-70 factor, ECF subfamily
MSTRDDRMSPPAPESRRAENLDALLTSAARGDRDAFDFVVTRLSGPIYGLAWAVVRDPAQAEEITQEALFEVWRTAVRYDASKGSAAAWALTIARRRAVDRVRSVAASSAREQRNFVTAVERDQVSETVQDSLDREELRRCLRMLSSRQLQAIVLAFYGGYSHSEIAVLLDLPLGTVKARIRDGITRLRTCMRNEQ